MASSSQARYALVPDLGVPSQNEANRSMTPASFQHGSSSLPSSRGGSAAQRQTACRVTMSGSVDRAVAIARAAVSVEAIAIARRRQELMEFIGSSPSRKLQLSLRRG